MIISIDEITDDKKFDVCVVGGGPAGITLALDLADKGKLVLLLESGGAEYSRDWQNFYIGENVGDPYFDLDVTRLRQFGGTSNHWEGWCRPLDEVDFTRKGYAPEASWPISKGDLDPYLARAMEILDISGDFEDAEIDDAVKRIDFKFSEPTRFAEKYQHKFSEGDGLFLAMNSSVTGVNLQDQKVESLEVRDLRGTVRNVYADAFVISCGGIENSRLLLHFNNQTQNHLIPDDRALGRYWSDHPHFTIGDFISSGEISQNEYYSLTPEAMREHGVLNCGLRVQPVNQRREGLKAIARDLACTAPRLGEWAYDKMNRNLSCFGELRAAWEQAPRAESRITLSIEKSDAFGIPQVVLDWKKSAYDIKTVRTTAMELGRMMAQTNRGRIMLHDWVLNDGPWPDDDELGGHHHMGGTRMSRSSDDGIVDTDLRLWAMKNTYVLGSSVFPSGGHTNPTLTIVQLALRLADTLVKA